MCIAQRKGLASLNYLITKSGESFRDAPLLKSSYIPFLRFPGFLALDNKKKSPAKLIAGLSGLGYVMILSFLNIYCLFPFFIFRNFKSN